MLQSCSHHFRWPNVIDHRGSWINIKFAHLPFSSAVTSSDICDFNWSTRHIVPHIEVVASIYVVTQSDSQNISLRYAEDAKQRNTFLIETLTQLLSNQPTIIPGLRYGRLTLADLSWLPMLPTLLSTLRMIQFQQIFLSLFQVRQMIPAVSAAFHGPKMANECQGNTTS